MPKEYTAKQLDARDLRGQLTPGKKLANMTPLEQAVLRHQGLVDEEDNIKPEAFEKTKEDLHLPPHIPAPISLEELEPGIAERITDAVSEARGTSAATANVNPEMQVDVPLPPPDSPDGDPILPPDAEEIDDGFGGRGGDTVMNVEVLLRRAKEPIPCPRCTYDVRQRFEDPAHDAADKAAFVRHVMSRKGRFEKRFEILGGHGAVIFRSRSQHEMEMIFGFVRKQLQKEDVLPGGDYYTQLQRYHIVASVAAIESDEPGDSEIFPTLDDLAEKGVESPVEELERQVFGSGRSGGLYSIITALWMEFDRLYGWFSSRAHEPDFWKAAAGPHS